MARPASVLRRREGRVPEVAPVELSLVTKASTPPLWLE